jgi:putative DNA primase/helicase
MSASINFDALKASVELSIIVSETLQLKRKGRLWTSPCPFHHERTPSFYVYPDTNKYHCFGCGEHGDVFDWLEKQRGFTLSEAIEYLGGNRSEHAASAVNSGPARPAPEIAARGSDPDVLRRIAIARRAWEQALPPQGTPVQAYLETRGVGLPDVDRIRWHPHCPREGGAMPAMVAPMVDPVTGQFRGLHRTFIKPDGSGKADVDRPRMMLGGSGIVQLVDPRDIGNGLGIAEGIETALSVMQAFGWGPVWATCTAGNIASFPYMPATTLNIFADADDTGAGMKAAHECRDNWTQYGGEVFIHEPPGGKDWNDLVGEIRS